MWPAPIPGARRARGSLLRPVRVPAFGESRRAGPESAAFARECAELIGRVAAGDQEALGRLYDMTNRRVFGLVLRILGDPTAAEEVVLDVYLQVHRQADRYDPARGAAFAWLFTIARSRAIDAMRRSRLALRRTAPLESLREREGDEAAPDEAAALAETRGAVLAALATLPPEQRAVVELAYYGGLSHSEIAEALAVPLGTVKTRTRLALTRLRAALDGLEW
jgi:RNA polymerase sigma-70 factor (ECF subfamily)